MGAIQRRAKSSPLRQTYLGLTTENTLTILDRHKTPQGEAFIFRLPDELLITIFELVTSGPRNREYDCDCDTLCNYTGLKTLARTCHGCNRIALPLLYRNIPQTYRYRTVPPSKAVKSLHRSLQKDPLLRQYCRRLTISIDDLAPEAKTEHYSIAHDIVSWSTAVRCARIHGGFSEMHNEHTWAFIRNAVQHMREIQHLSISREFPGPDLRQIMEHVDFPSLRMLEVHGISETPNGAVVLEPKKHRTASFSTLILSDYEASPQDTAQLLRWPNQLSHFRFCSFYNTRFYMDLPMFRSMLLMHKDTLKTIDIGCLSSSGRGRLFNVSDFPNLEVLKLSRWQMEENLEFSSTQADLLLAPNLKTFGWSFSIFDQHNESWTDFGDREERWVREFAKAAIARKAALKKIKITFDPDEWGSKEQDGYPWDRMDKIRDELRPRGIALEYSEPPLSKEAWLEQKR